MKNSNNRKNSTNWQSYINRKNSINWKNSINRKTSNNRIFTYSVSKWGGVNWAQQVTSRYHICMNLIMFHFQYQNENFTCYICLTRISVIRCWPLLVATCGLPFEPMRASVGHAVWLLQFFRPPSVPFQENWFGFPTSSRWTHMTCPMSYSYFHFSTSSQASKLR